MGSKNKKPKLSVVLATHNEEKNLKRCLSSVVGLADEIVIVDGDSTDKTRQIARSFGAKVIKSKNYPIFHVNKQKALEAASGDWILQLDADEVVSHSLACEIKKVIKMTDKEIEAYQEKLPDRRLFVRHQKLLEMRDGRIGKKKGSFAGFFLPRLNFILGKFLRYGGVYPDGVIRLVKRGKAWFPAKSVHEQIVVDGRVGWLGHPLLHYDSPTLQRYLEKNSRYIELLKEEFQRQRLGKNPKEFLVYFFFKPTAWFLKTTLLHKGFLDGIPGIVFSFFSALRFPRAYWRYLHG